MALALEVLLWVADPSQQVAVALAELFLVLVGPSQEVLRH